jgi:tetratricopeptide (TPR) repeat protein
MAIKKKLLDLLEHTHLEEWSFIDNLSASERNEIGSPQHWSAKDTIAHNAEWCHRLAQSLASIVQGEPTESDYNFDEANQQIYAQYHHIAWGDVESFLDSVHKELINQLEQLESQTLLEVGHYETLENRPLWRYIVSIAHTHPLAHMSEFLLKRGRQDQAIQLQESAYQKVSSLSDEPSWTGVALYNLACYYALAGANEKAILRLREALALRPDLEAWSLEDPDLESVRFEPAYQLIYEELGGVPNGARSL